MMPCLVTTVQLWMDEVLRDCTRGVRHTDTNALLALLTRMNNAARQQKTALTAPQLDVLITFLLMHIRKESSAGGTRNELLRSLGFVVFEGGARCVKFHKRLLELCIPRTKPGVASVDETRLCVNILGNLCTKGTNRIQDIYAPVYRALLEVFEWGVKNEATWRANAGLAELIAAALRALRGVVVEAKTLHVPRLANIVSSTRRFVFAMPIHPQPKPNANSNANATANANANADANSNTQQQQQQQPASSDTAAPAEAGGTPTEPTPAQAATKDLSVAIPSSNSSSKTHSHQHCGTPTAAASSPAPPAAPATPAAAVPSLQTSLSRVRIYACVFLQGIARVSNRNLMEYWPLLLAQQRSTEARPREPSLFTLMLYDAYPKVRAAALMTLKLMLDNSRKYLATAEVRSSPRSGGVSSFTPKTEVLAHIVHEMHTTLMHAMRQEKSPAVVPALVRCVAQLIANTTYTRFPEGLLTLMFEALLKYYGFVTMEDVSVEQAMVAALLPVFEKTFNAPNTPKGKAGAPIAEVVQLLRTEVDVKNMIYPSIISFLVEKASMSRENALPVREEAFAVLGRIGSHYARELHLEWADVSGLLYSAFEPQFGENEVIQDRAIKLIEDIGRGTGLATGETPSEEDMNDILLPFWNEVLEEHLTRAFDLPRVRAGVCNAMALIPDVVFQQLPLERRIVCITLMLSAVSSNQPLEVHAAACRTLGVFVTHRCLRDDPLFLADTANALVESSKDPNQAVRIRLAWAIANLCDAIRLSAEEQQQQQQQHDSVSSSFLPDHMVTRLPELFELTLKLCMEGDKIRSNAVRALGILARIAPASLLLEPARKINTADNPPVPAGEEVPSTTLAVNDVKLGTDAFLTQILNTLSANLQSGPVKVRWNACYAFTNLFQNTMLEAESDNVLVWVRSACEDLALAMRTCDNFKIRINSAGALALVPSRAHFGSAYLDVLDTLAERLLMLEKDMEEQQESKKYGSSLREALVGTIARVYELRAAGEQEDAVRVLRRAKDAVRAVVDVPEGREEAWRAVVEAVRTA